MSSASITPGQLRELRRRMLERDRLLPAKLDYEAAEAYVLAYLRELQFEAGHPTTTALNEDGTWAGVPPEDKET